MLSVSAMTDTDNKMTSLALHGVTAPSQVSKPVGGLVGASNEGGSLTPMLKPVTGLSEFLSEYIEEKNRFEAELRTTLQEAKKAAASMEVMKYADDEPDKSADAEDKAPSQPQDAAKESVGTVANFADRYNALTNFMNENQNVSRHAASLTSLLSDASRSVGTFSSIGITADANGKLHVNSARLEASLKNRPESVEYALGKDGLAGRAEKGIKLAAFNQKRLFPSVSSAMGREDNPTKSMYSPKAVAAQNDFSDRGAMLNLYS